MTHHERSQVDEAIAPSRDLSAWDWKADLKREERSLEWLARRTQRSLHTVNAYSQGRLNPPAAWLSMADVVLNGARS